MVVTSSSLRPLYFEHSNKIFSIHKEGRKWRVKRGKRQKLFMCLLLPFTSAMRRRCTVMYLCRARCQWLARAADGAHARARKHMCETWVGAAGVNTIFKSSLFLSHSLFLSFSLSHTFSFTLSLSCQPGQQQQAGYRWEKVKVDFFNRIEANLHQRLKRRKKLVAQTKKKHFQKWLLEIWFFCCWCENKTCLKR